MKSVAICIVTYRRVRELVRLLDSLAELSFADRCEPEIEVIVVDNDPHGSARHVCADWARTAKWPVRYAREPRPGIAHARNKAVSLALQRSEGIAFVDDDETADPEWLAALIQTAQNTGVDIVTGPVTSHLAESVPAWIRLAGVFDRPRYEDGSDVQEARTGNVLIGRAVFERVPEGFDARFGLTGGSDTLFFLRARQVGCRIVWSDRAVVTEWIPQSRARTGWILRRAFRGGNSYTRCSLTLGDSLALRAGHLGRGVARILVALIGVLPALLQGRPAALRRMQDLSKGLGTIAAVIGWAYKEYGRSRGSV